MKTPRELLLEKHAAASRRATFTPPARSRIIAFNWNIVALAALWMAIVFLKLDSPTMHRGPRAVSSQPLNPIASIEIRRAEILNMLESMEAPEIPDPLKAAWMRRQNYVV